MRWLIKLPIMREDRVKEYAFTEDTTWIEPITGLLREERPFFVLEKDMELWMPHKRKPLPAEKKLFEIGKRWFLKLHEKEINEEKWNFVANKKKRELGQVKREIGQKKKELRTRNLSPEGRMRLVNLEQRRRELGKDIEKLFRKKGNLELNKELEKQGLELEKTGSIPLRAKPAKRGKQSRRKTI